jgi:acetoin utilization deacetylase AcuC-like enzyme
MPVAPGAGNREFCALAEHVVAPIARSWRPDLVAISAGFDAHREDPLADCRVDEDGFATMAATARPPVVRMPPAASPARVILVQDFANGRAR